MKKFFFALFISLAYAANFPDPKDTRVIKKVSTSRFNSLNFDTFCCIIAFLSGEEVLNLRFLNMETYRRVRKLWRQMRLSTVINGSWPDHPVNFSHILEIRGVDIEDQASFRKHVQLSYLQDFSLECKNMHNLQYVVDLLPRDSLTRLCLRNFESTCPLVSKIDFPNLTHLQLSWGIDLNYGTFSSLPNCMKVLEVIGGYMDITTSSSLNTVLRTMNELEVLSLRYCTFSKDSLFAILESLPASLKRLNINCTKLLDPDANFPELGLIRLRKMEYLEKINFMGVSNELATEIISNLPECITDICCRMGGEILNVFQKQARSFRNVRRIYISRATTIDLYPTILEIFPSLDEDIKNVLLDKHI